MGAKAAADAKEEAEAMTLTQEAGEPQWASLKAMGEKKVSNNLADYESVTPYRMSDSRWTVAVLSLVW